MWSANEVSTVAAGPALPGLRSRSFRLMLVASFGGFGGYAVLLSVVPLWASRGGAGELAAGATTGVLMAATVGTQFVVPWLLRRIGYRPVLALGMVLLGAPAPIYAVSTELPVLLGVSAARGVGFGLLTVAGSALVAELVRPAEHGRASALYGAAVGLPQLLLLPLGVGIATAVGFVPMFVLAGALPLAGALVVPWIRVPAATPAGAPAVDRARVPVRAFASPWFAMLACSVAQGGLVTFLPLAVPGSPVVVPLALFATVAGALGGRLLAGELADRRRLAGRLQWAGIALAGAGMLAVLVTTLGAGPVPVVLGAALVGVGFGIVQNDSMVAMFAAGGVAGYGSASAAWNIAYDTGTGVGAVALGAVAEPLGFTAAFGASALLLAVTLPVALPRRR